MRTSERQLPLTLLAMASLLTLGACGGGGGGSTPAGSTPSPVASRGVIASTAAGSVVVNGTTFSTAAATVSIDDNPSTADLLKPGMVVTIHGSSDDALGTGTADQISARDILEGTVTAVGANTLTVMGQTVQIEDNVTRLNDDDTIKTFAAAGFAPNDVVEVHGFANDDPLNPGIRAARVFRKASGEFEAKGFLLGTVSPFGLALTPNGAQVLSVTGTLPAGAVTGSLVEVKASGAPAGGALTATTVKLEDSLSGPKVEVEGLVTSGDSSAFTVNGHAVVTSGSTVFEGGPKGDVLPGAKVEAEGPMSASGVITAVKVSFRSNIRFEGDATVTGTGPLTILGGMTVAFNPFTRMDTAIADGVHHLEIRAMPDRDGNLIATRITDRGASDQKAFLQGPITAADSGTGNLTILGSTISTSGALFRVDFDGAPEVGVSRATFFGQLKPSRTVVKVKWDPFVALTSSVKEAEIQLGH